MSILSPLIALYSYALQPVAPFTWLGLGVTSLDLVAAVRLCVVLRQIKEALRAQHMAKNGPVVEKSFVHSLTACLIVVYGGETMSGPLLGVPPSFMISPVFPTLYAVTQAIVDKLPAVPSPTLQIEMPLAIVDAFTRAYLLCNLIPPSVTKLSTNPALAESPWALLLTALITANGGFFLTNMFSFLHPYTLTLATPPELQPWGWTTTDLWCAPLVTGIYALLTHEQPFWAEAHTFIMHLIGGMEPVINANGEKVKLMADAVDSEVARAACAAFLVVLFTTRTAKNFGLQWKGNAPKPVRKIKEKTQ